ncbi:TetR/AcrR family transcriptional regulator [Saccharibacillus sp. CPCC 101409]|uniref:TetR/AcrR family transcriptional regulator n=1 Tax=Saccharibacillus sp. CPCC 101409 TaxID=3058041 RepID=UPI002672857B|nr:TetR/AcrR family transcriptional regulator [Saccharibacillus sp. CPCC 101409]MDO3411658.1 TetR/AcrR family transcriptional regulator [Saccharibacillus sp. CPCC 101409]
MENKKRRILEAAMLCFERFGFRGTTIGSVAKTAGMSKSGIYDCFENKEALLQEIVRGILGELVEETERAVRAGRPLRDDIETTFDAVIALRGRHRLLVGIYREARVFGTQGVVDMRKTLEEGVVSYIEGLVRRHEERGEQFRLPARVIAFLVYRVYLQLIYDWEDLYEPLPPEQIKAALKSFAL